jgi:hypothetical protein
LRYDVAGPSDDADLARLLRELPLGGRVEVSLEREPSVLEAARITGDRQEFLIARDEATGAAEGFGGRFEMDAYINGDVARLGYLGELRLSHGGRRRLGHAILGAYEAMRALHERGTTSFYFTTIVSDSLAARRLLESGLRGLPVYRPFDRLLSFVIATRGRRRGGRGDHLLRSGETVGLPAIASHLEAHGRGRQLHAVWTEQSLGPGGRCPGLALEDFLVIEEKGRIAGLLGLWDQRAFKQSVVRGYAPALSLLRPAYNLVAPLLGRAALPAPGTRLETAFLSHIAVREAGAAILLALVDAACARAAARGLDYAAIGLSARDPLAGALERAFSCYRYESEIYLVYWPDGEAAARAVAETTSHLELAIL